MKKRMLSFLLALCMVVSNVPVYGYAQEVSQGEPAVCTCGTACSEESVNMDCPVCGAEGAALDSCDGTAEEWIAADEDDVAVIDEPAYDVVTTAEDTDGDGYVEIDTAEKLWWFTQQVNGGNKSLNAELTANIDLVGTCGEEIGNWLPISHSDGYKGHFNGQGFTISNLYITGNELYVGLFGYVSGAIIENVTVTGSVSSTMIYDESYYFAAAGGIVAYMDSGTIRNCHVDMTVSGKWYIGGICGICGTMYRGLIEDCTVNGNVICNLSVDQGSGSFIGGIVGCQYGGTVRGCVNRATASAENSVYFGGIAGLGKGDAIENCLNYGTFHAIYDSTYAGGTTAGGIVGSGRTVIRGCGNLGLINISGTGEWTGGIAGFHQTSSGIVENCYNVGSITSSDGKFGVIVGATDTSAIVTNNYYLNDTATEDGGRTAEQFASGQVAYELNGSTTTDESVWKQTLGTDSYPVLKGEQVYYNDGSYCDGVKYSGYSNTQLGAFVHTSTEQKLLANNNGTHNVVWSCCDTVVTENVVCTPVNAGTCVCGYVFPHSHDGVEFTEWTSTDAMPTVGGNYCLAGDVTLNGTWYVNGTVNLCLNGHSIIQTADKNCISLNADTNLNIYDCGTTGKITHAEGATGFGVVIPGYCNVILYSGSICGNTVGVHVGDGTFTMKGGSITDNHNPKDYGGGVYANNATFIMEGGTISGNTAADGGGVFLISSASSFVMKGGSIANNHAASFGGGVNVNSGSFTMEGGSITGNTAALLGGGVAQLYTMTVSGSAVIRDNLVKAEDDAAGTPSNVLLWHPEGFEEYKTYLTVGELTDGAAIGVTCVNVDVYTEIFTVAPGTVSANAAGEYAKYFTADDSAYEVTVNDDGYLALAEVSKPVIDPVAEVNGVKYTSLEAAIDAANSGDTVTLLQDVEYHEKIANGFDVTISKSLTLNLGEYWIRDTLTGSSFVENGVPYTIGVLKIKPVDSDVNVIINATTGGISTASTRYAIHSGNGTTYNANVTINGGNYIGGDICIKQDKGTLTITDGSFQVTSKNYPNQYVLDTTDKYVGKAKFNITGGRFKGFNPACCFVDNGKRHDHSHISDGYTGVLGEDGWYTVQQGERVAKTGYWCYSTLMDAINNINIKKEGNEIKVIAAYEVTAEEAAAVIEKDLNVYKDGADPALPAGYVWNENNQFVKAPEIAIAEVNGTQYADLQTAIDAASSGDTVTVLCDVSYEEADDYLFINKSLTLDLGEHTITYTAEGAEDGFDLGKGDVDYKDRPLNYAYAALIIRAENETINVTINATTGGITAAGTYAYAINAGNIGDGNDAYKTNLTINGGSYTSASNCAVYQNNGVCTINDGSYRADGQSDIANSQPVYNTLVLNNKDYYEGSFVINGGRFYGFNPACLSINKHDHHDHDSIADGKTGVLGEDGWFTVQEGSLVAKTVCTAKAPASAHGHCYASLEDAMKALENCCEKDKIELIADVTPYAAVHVGSGENKDKVIVIDAGHQENANEELEPNGPGSSTMKAKVASGTYGRFTGIKEYVLNLEVAIALRDELLSRGYTVVMVRESHDVDISNVERAQVANVYDADALIRIHANGDNNASKSGAMGLCQTQNNPYPDCKAVYAESLLLTNSILDAYCKETGMEKGSVWKTDTMTGINWVSVPATILEMGYMTNKSDDNYMATAEFKPLAAEGIANGLDAYFAAQLKDQDKESGQPEIDSPKSIKILSIGNSFSVDAHTYLYEVLKAFGIDNVVIGNMYVAGSQLETHYSNAVNDKAEYIYYLYNNTNTLSTTKKVKISTVLAAEDWDIITFQQSSGKSGKANTYDTTKLNYLVDLAKASINNPDLKVGWHMTWAYQQDSTHADFPNYGNDQMTMYNAIVDATNSKILTNTNFDFVIPAGTAIQNARTSYLGDTLTRDGYHLSNTGRYIASLTWALQCMGLNISAFDTSMISSEFLADIDMIKESAVNAVNFPYEVTASAYSDEDTNPDTGTDTAPDHGLTVLEQVERDGILYDVVDWQPTQGYWNCAKYTTLQTPATASSANVATAKKYISSGFRFTKDNLPNGTIILLADTATYEYKADGWENETETSKINRPGAIRTAEVVIDDDWWGNYTLRSFNVSKKTPVDMTGKEDEVREIFKILIPVK